MQLNNTPIQLKTINNQAFYIKRDDLIHDEFSGNKARKFLYFLDNEFENITKLISYGSAQSNAMYSLSALAKLKGWSFEFYVDHIPTHIKQNPRGNYKGALENGANIIEDESFINNTFVIPHDAIFVPEGGRCEQSEYGITKLASELEDWINEKELNYEDVKIMLPSGTGTTALFLQKNLPLDIEVLTVACVGGDEYLKKQFFDLEKDENFHPTILQTPKKYHFGKLYKEFYEIWKDINDQSGINFELLYDPLGWQTILEYNTKNKDKIIIYIHQGGLKGNETMLERYSRKYDK
jgi:1-aminocyclopropane-1-carboxylate deaminase/D-cysteine desulfhydrase-like pyridoxal-dependent ACC family enzyme